MSFVMDTYAGSQDRASANGSIKGQRVNILGLMGHRVSGGTAQLCHCSTKTAPDNMKMN